MNFVSIRIITSDVRRLVGFYEDVTGLPARWATGDFAELATPGGTIAIASTGTLGLFGDDDAVAAANRTVIIELRVDDVDREHERIHNGVTELVQAPTTMPWGNRSMLFRDPDGNLINLFTPVTDEAIARIDG